MPGSRPGGLVASTWAAMMLVGKEGYVENAREMVMVAKKIADGIRQIPGLELCCEPDVTVVAFQSPVFDINRLQHGLVEEKGWDINILQFPSAMHLCVTMAHTSEGVAENFLRDLAAAAAPLYANPGEKTTGAGAMYGMAQALPDRSIVEEVCKAYIDCVYTVEPPEGVVTANGGDSPAETPKRRGRTPKKTGAQSRLLSP